MWSSPRVEREYVIYVSLFSVNAVTQPYLADLRKHTLLTFETKYDNLHLKKMRL